MTEKEAKEKWCPFSRLAEDDAPRTVANRFVGEGATWGTTLCIAAECMAWRWVERMTNDEIRTGFCGPAGKP